MSKTVVTYPIVGAVLTAETIPELGSNRRWTPTNDTQRAFLKEFFLGGRQEIPRIPEIESKASWDYEVINRFLAERGFTIALQPFTSDTFGVASVLDLLVEWLIEGVEDRILTPDRKVYPGVLLPEDGVEFWSAKGHDNPIAALKTKSGDKIFMTMMDNPPEGFAMVEKAQELSRTSERIFDFGGLIFPMVDLNQEVNISWLIGLWCMADSGDRARISQALQQTKLKMNEKGAHVKSAVAIAVTLEAFRMPKETHVINRPFLMWIERTGLSRPLFVGHITQEDWKNPGSLDM